MNRKSLQAANGAAEEAHQASAPSSSNRPTLWAIVGPTGSGKGNVARRVAKRIGGEIISLDSMKIYRGLDVGTGKPSAETRERVPHHLIDVVEPDEGFDVRRYVETASAAWRGITDRGKQPLFCGGTALYLVGLLKGLFEGPAADPALRQRFKAEAEEQGAEALHHRLSTVDPDAAAKIHPRDLRRIIRALEVFEKTGRPLSKFHSGFEEREGEFQGRLVGIRWSKEKHRLRIDHRVDRMFELGLVEEVESLRDAGRLGRWSRSALGYPEILDALEGRISLGEAREAIKLHTWRYARQQRTWFKRFPEIQWYEADEWISEEEGSESQEEEDWQKLAEAVANSLSGSESS